MAWLTAIPKGKDDTRAQQIKTLAESNGERPDYGFPDVNGVEHLINYLSEIGEAKTNGSILVPQDWQEIKAWKEITCTELNTWELVTIMKMSIAYARQYNKSSAPDCLSPVADAAKNVNKVESRFKTLFSLMGKSKND